MARFSLVLLLLLDVLATSTVAAAKVHRSTSWLELIDAAPCDECQTRITRAELRTLGLKGLTARVAKLKLQVGELKEDLEDLDKENGKDLEKLTKANKNVTDKFPDINKIPLRIEDELKLKKQIEEAEVLDMKVHNATIEELEAAKKARDALGEKVAEAGSSTCWTQIAGYLSVKLVQLHSETHRISSKRSSDEPGEIPRQMSDSQIEDMVNDLSAGLLLTKGALMAGEDEKSEADEAAKIEKLVREAEALETERDDLKAKETRNFQVYRQQQQRLLDESTKAGQILYERRLIVIREEEAAKGRVRYLQRQLDYAKLFYAHEKPKLDRVKALTAHYTEKTKELEDLIQACLCRIKKSFTKEEKTCCNRQIMHRVTGNIYDPETCMALCASKGGGCTHVGFKEGVCELFKGCDKPEFKETEKVYRYVKPPEKVGFFVNHDFEVEMLEKSKSVKVVPFWEGSSSATFVVQNDKDWGGISSGSGRQFLGLKAKGATTSQKVEGLTKDEEYVVIFLAADSPKYAGAKLKVTADGAETAITLSKSFARYEAPFKAKAESAEIKFEQTEDGDKAALIDDIKIEKDDQLRADGDGHCAGEPVYSSSAWELGPSFEGEKDFNTPEYRAWRADAMKRCLAKDKYTKFVSVWKDAGFRCYKAEECKATEADGVRSWKYLKFEKEPKEEEALIAMHIDAQGELEEAPKPILIRAEGQGDFCCRGERQGGIAEGADLDKCYKECAEKDCRHVDLIDKSCSIYGACGGDADGYEFFVYAEKDDQR